MSLFPHHYTTWLSLYTPRSPLSYVDACVWLHCILHLRAPLFYTVVTFCLCYPTRTFSIYVHRYPIQLLCFISVILHRHCILCAPISHVDATSSPLSYTDDPICVLHYSMRMLRSFTLIPWRTVHFAWLRIPWFDIVYVQLTAYSIWILLSYMDVHVLIAYFLSTFDYVYPIAYIYASCIFYCTCLWWHLFYCVHLFSYIPLCIHLHCLRALTFDTTVHTHLFVCMLRDSTRCSRTNYVYSIILTSSHEHCYPIQLPHLFYHTQYSCSIIPYGCWDTDHAHVSTHIFVFTLLCFHLYYGWHPMFVYRVRSLDMDVMQVYSLCAFYAFTCYLLHHHALHSVFSFHPFLWGTASALISHCMKRVRRHKGSQPRQEQSCMFIFFIIDHSLFIPCSCIAFQPSSKQTNPFR